MNNDAKSKRLISLRPVTKKDRKVIIAQSAKIFELKKESLAQLWHWLFDLNPARKKQPFDGWVLEVDGKIVGHQGVLPQLFNISGKEQIVSFGCFYYVIPEYRSMGIQIANKFQTSNKIERPLTLSAGETTHKIYMRLGFNEIPQNNNIDYIWPINWDRVIKERLQDYGGNKKLISLITINRPILKLLGKLWSRFKWRKNYSYSIQSCFHLSCNVDVLWDELKNSYNIMSVRDRQYIQWRYFDNPLKKSIKFFSISNNQGSLKGYFAYTIRKRKNSDLKILEILDIFCDHNNKNMVYTALKQIITDAYKLDVDIVQIQFMPMSVKSILNKIGFFRRIKDFVPTLIQNNNIFPDDLLSDYSNWYICPADGESIDGISPVHMNSE